LIRPHGATTGQDYTYRGQLVLHKVEVFGC
jgi:hypothetical protein